MRTQGTIIIIALFFQTLPACGQKNEGRMDQEQKFPVQKSEAEWKKELNEEEYRILREAGTERPGSGKYYQSKEDGIFRCTACDNPLFDSETKFESGSGWPSFYKPVNEESIVKRTDRSAGMVRTEVLCGKCGGHLGHVFDDGPDPTGERYCINSVALDLDKR